jgi:hypothetical protein
VLTRWKTVDWGRVQTRALRRKYEKKRNKKKRGNSKNKNQKGRGSIPHQREKREQTIKVKLNMQKNKKVPDERIEPGAFGTFEKNKKTKSSPREELTRNLRQPPWTLKQLAENNSDRIFLTKCRFL